MPLNMDPRLVGRVWMTPDTPIIAGQYGTWTITYEVGEYGYDERARLKIAARFASDWATPQFKDPAAANYASVRLDSRSKTSVASLTYEPRGQVRPWFKSYVTSVADGSLYPGDRIHITIGDTSGGGRGSRAQTFRETQCEWRVFVDPFGTELYEVLPDSPRFDIVGGDIHRLVVVAPTTVRADEPFDAVVKAEDIWGNPCEWFSGRIALAAEGDTLSGLLTSVDFESGKRAVARLTDLQLSSGSARILATFGNHSAKSNAIQVIGAGEMLEFWGDLHGQTKATVGTGTHDEYFSFGRDVALLDFMGHQGNDFQVTKDEWSQLCDCIESFNKPGQFVLFHGYEWSGMTPAGGDRNVHFRGKPGPLHRTSHAEIADMSDASLDRYPLPELYDAFRDRDDVILLPHVGGRYANILDFHDPKLEPLIELYSDWGRFEWMIFDGLERGYRVGVTAGSDGHKGRPGASHPGAAEFGVCGGLTCVLADSLTRDSIFDALRARRCYATSRAHRIHVELTVNGLPIGADGKLAAEVTLRGQVVGTGPIQKIEIFRGTHIIHTISPYTEASLQESNLYRVGWAGSRVRGRDRLTKWDGTIELTAGRIADAQPWSIENPERGIKDPSDRRIVFTSTTTGGDNGFDLELQDAADATIQLRTAVLNTEFQLAHLQDGSTVLRPAGGVDLRAFARRLPLRDHTSRLLIDWTDHPPPTLKTAAYWIRATQEDGVQAWTSPVYLDRK